MVVISVSISTRELREFDAIVAEMTYKGRSAAVRDAIHKFVQDHRWVHAVGHGEHFLMSVLYEERSKDSVSNVLHRFRGLIHNSAHTHFDGKCVDQLVLLGPGKDVTAFLKELSSVRDVRVCDCFV